MPLPIKRAAERPVAISSNGCPLSIAQINIRRQLDDDCFVKNLESTHQFRQSRQLLCGVDLKCSLLVIMPSGVGRAIPHVRGVLGVQQSDLVIAVILVLGGLLVLVLLVLVLPIGGLVLLILIGLVGVVALTLAGVLILISGLGGLFVLAVLGVLVLAVLAVSGSIHVLAVAALGILIGVDISRVRVALDDGRTAAAHHLRGKGRGSHQRQREHHAHQQAHHAPGQIACPFLHVICSSLC